MGDEMDGCECVWTHEFAMQRLLQFIRQNQNHCTDTDCIDVTGRLQHVQSAPNGDEDRNFMLMSVFMIIAMIMYFIRPETLLRMTGTKRRPLTQNKHDSNNGGGTPPPPPPAPPAVN